MNTKSSLSSVIVVMMAATALSVSTTLMVYAQSTISPQVDGGNNSTATTNATASAAFDEKNDTGIEEGPGEDAEEQGDTDVNDTEE
jgi:hypothetical protein